MRTIDMHVLAHCLDSARLILMNGAVIKMLREGETAACDCCGAELTKRVVTANAGNFGASCWKTISAEARRLRDARKFNPEGAEDRAEVRSGRRWAWVKAVAA